MKIVPIPKELLSNVWTLVKKDIAKALWDSGNQTDSDFVLTMLKQDKLQLWVVWNNDKPTLEEKYKGVVVTEIVKRKLKTSCHIFIMTGKGRKEWQHLISVIEDFATQNGCDQMELYARAGWQKVLEQYQYRRTHVVLEKQLNIKKENQ